MPTVNCPPRETLLGFARGDLPDDKIESVSDHLESCAGCEDTIALFEGQSDTFIGRLQAPVVKSRFADEPEFDRAVAAAKAVGREPDVAATQPAVATPDDSLGQIGDYQLLAKLGHGGMGTVYRALHTRMRRVVALKVLTTHRRHDPAVVERFGREIEAAGKLSHPNIVTAHDAGEEDGMHYLVMELVEGVDLHTLVSQHGPLPVADACEIIRQTARGLQHAHEHGLVHRDLKPSNLMVAVSGQRSAVSSQASAASSDAEAAGNQELKADGCSLTASVKILDLGLARLQDDQKQEREEITATGQVMGTLDYMAPEQADDSHGVDIRSDIYALGCTLSKLLTGRAPFSGEPYNSLAKKLRGHAEDAPPPIRAARPEVSEELADLITRMLAKSPDDRPATPADLAAALEPFCDGCDLPALVSRIDIPAQRELNPASQAEIAKMLPKLSVPGRRRRLGIFAAVTALMLFLAAAAAVVIIIQRGDGPATTVEVPEGSEVKIDEGGRVAVSLPGEQSPVAGQAVNGLTVSVSVGSTEWKPGDAIELTCLYKNESSEPIHVPRWGVALPAMEITKYVDTEILRDAVPANFDRKMLQLPQAPEVEKQQLWKDIFVEVRPGQTASITRRGVLDKNGRLSIHWPNGAVQTWTLQNGRFHLTAILEFNEHDRTLGKLAQEAGLENIWYGKAVSGTADVTVSGTSPTPADQSTTEPSYGGRPLSYWAAQLKDDDPEFRRMAAVPLLKFGQAGNKLLIEVLGRGDVQSRLLLVNCLESMHADGKNALPALIKAMDDPNDDVQRLALYCFWDFGFVWLVNSGGDAQDVLPALIRALDDSGDQVRVRATDCLAKYGSDAADALPALIWALDDPNAEVRAGATTCLGKFGSDARDAIPALIRNLDDPDADVRARSGFCLGQIGNDARHALPALIRNLDDPDARVRANTAISLGKFGSDARDAVPALLRLLDDSDLALRQVAVWGLWKTGVQSDEVVSALIRVAENHDCGAVVEAARVLGEFPDHAAKTIPVLVALATDPRGKPTTPLLSDPYVPSYHGADRVFKERAEYGFELPGAAMSSLMRLDEQEYTRIIEFSRHARPYIRQVAASCLSSIDRREAIDRLIAMLDDKDPGVRSVVRQDLRRVARIRPSQLLAALSEGAPADQIAIGLHLATDHLPYDVRAAAGLASDPYVEVAPESLTPETAEQSARKVAAGVRFALRFLRQTDESREQHDESQVAASRSVPVPGPGQRAANRSVVVVGLGLLDADQAKQVLPPLLLTEKLPEVRSTIVAVLRFLGEEVPEDDAAEATSAPVSGKPEALEGQVDRLIEEALKLMMKNAARGISSLRAELDRVQELPDVDPAQRLVLTDKIQSTINRLQGFADRRNKWKTDVQAAIAEAKELAKTDPQAAARRLYGACGRAHNAAELLGMGAAFLHDHDLLQLSNEHESLAKKLDPKGEASRRMGAERWTRLVQEALSDAMAEIRTHAGNRYATPAVALAIVEARLEFERCRSLAGEIEDEQILAETLRKIDDAQQQFASAVRWSFRNPLVLDSYHAPDRLTSGPVAWGLTRHGLVLTSGRRAGNGPLDVWHGGPPTGGRDLFGFRHVGSVGDASWPLLLATDHGTCVASSAGIDGDVITLRIWDCDVERGGAEWQPREVKWQLKPPIRVDQGGSAVMHAHTSFRQEKGDKVNHVLSLFLRLSDGANADRSQLLFVRSPDGGKTWPEQPKLVANGVRWPGPALRPVCFHDYTVQEDPDHHLVCLAMDEDNKAVFFRTQDGGEHWTKEIALLPDPETGKSLPGIPLASPNPGRTLVYAIPASDKSAQKYHLCHAWTGSGGRSWGGATTIASDLVLTDDQLYSIRTCTAGVTAVTCPVAGDGPDDWRVQLLLSIDEGARTWRAIPLDERLGGRVGLTALQTWGQCRIFLAAEVENPARTENRRQLIVQEIVPVALEFAAAGEDEQQDNSSNNASTNRGG